MPFKRILRKLQGKKKKSESINGENAPTPVVSSPTFVIKARASSLTSPAPVRIHSPLPPIGFAIPEIIEPPPTDSPSLPPSRLPCPICFCEPSDHSWRVLQDCGCRFCEECIASYTRLCIREGSITLTCPSGSCASSGHVTATEVAELVEPPVLQLYLRLKLNQEVAADPTKCWCPRPGCETVCDVPVPPPKPPKNSWLPKLPSRPSRVPVACPTCKFIFCNQCHFPWHNVSPCTRRHPVPQNSFPAEAWLLASLNGNKEEQNSEEIANRIKACPFCHVLIERDEGCAQMLCRHCKHVFCWHCLASLDDDFLLRHYDRGPCQERLGHTRITVALHRVQVLAVFFGMGILFLAATPILILASPALLCMSCRNRVKADGGNGTSRFM